ncbi:hypothetical protein [Burkholderia perseverans]|uniref:hypothetical protein n=1 Tax=Burkholderia perseverans TaxID=2615214 RepID=UPI001FEE418E|nr:hypothetical protein [Burkholderia perseverans]
MKKSNSLSAAGLLNMIQLFHAQNHCFMREHQESCIHTDVAVFADSITSQRGVRFASLHMISALVERSLHRHGDVAERHEHLHV